MSACPRVKLGDVAIIINGATPDTKNPAYWVGPHRWVTPAEMGGLNNPYLSTTNRTLSDEGLASCSARLAPPNSIILSTRAPIGHLVINTVPMATNQGCRSIVPSAQLNHEYLYYVLKGSVAELNALGTGTTFLELSAGKLKNFEIPLPSLEVQEGIAEQISNVKQVADTLSTLLERRSSSLNELEEVVVSALVSSKGNEEWVTQRLDQWATVMTGPFGSLVHKSDYQTSGPALVNPQDIVDGQIQTGKIKRISEEKATELSRWKLNPGDIVLGRRGEMGRCAVVSEEMAGSICGTGSFLIRPSGGCSAPFLAQILRSSGYRRKLASLSTGSTMDNLNNQVLGGLEVALPPLELQELLLGEVATAKDAVLRIRKGVSEMEKLANGLLLSAIFHLTEVTDAA